MQVWIVEEGHLVSYERGGECNQCGECCCKHSIQVSMQSIHDREDTENGDLSQLSDYEGWSALHDGDRWYWFKTISVSKGSEVCDALDPETHLCTIWQDEEEFKPVCRYWPWHPSDILPFERCSFYFEKSSPEDYDCRMT